ncbi:MAG: signal transduction histidine kinase [Anaerocolumna sp.]|jgi:signal transduction histidine kinase|nr:signal transduction histidine kinase [Anaerocolumna sp.]
MKLSWKIFRNTILLVLFALSLAGTIMISRTFHESISLEVDHEKDTLLSMERDVAILIGNDSRILYMDKKLVFDSLIEIIKDNWKSKNIDFRIKDSKNNILLLDGENTFIPIDIKVLKVDSISYIIHSMNDNYYLQVSGLIMLDDEPIVIEKCTNISNIFSLRKIQQKYFLKIILVVGILCAVLNYMNVFWISRELKKLTDIMIKMQQGDLTGRVHNSTDNELGVLSEQFNHMADRLEANIYELKEAARKQEEFVGSFTHEIRTPLTSIIGYADLLRRKQLDEETFFTATNHIYTEGKRLEILSTKLLDLLVEKSAEPEYVEIPIKKLVKDSISIVQPALNKKSITVITDFKDFKVRVDESLMKTVVVNLIDNARKAVNDNGRIIIECHIEKDKVLLSVSDNGKGIPESELPKISEAFYRVDKSRSRKEGGAGLGLTICANILKLHKGEIRFESKVDNGTKVTLYWEGAIYEA